MKALKSQLAKKIRCLGILIPRHDGAKFVFEGKEYIVRKVPKASLWWGWQGFDWAISKDMDNTVGEDRNKAKIVNATANTIEGFTLDMSAFDTVEAEMAA